MTIAFGMYVAFGRCNKEQLGRDNGNNSRWCSSIYKVIVFAYIIPRLL